MPELPEVEALARFLTERCHGRTVERAELAAISALKTYALPLSQVVGCGLGDWGRRGKHLCVPLLEARPGARPQPDAYPQPWYLVLHLSRGGWVQWRDPLVTTRAKPGRGPLALRIGLSGGVGFDVTEQGTEKRLAIWLVNDPGEIDGVARLGADPLGPGFDRDCLARALAGRPGNLKNVLIDQSVLAGVGNAYSDEALHAARLSPFKGAAKLSPDEVDALYQALVGVLGSALERSSGLAASGLKAEKKGGMAVHGRTGEPCPVCGEAVREVAFVNKSLQYCPRCQTGGKLLADRRLSRLLK